MKRGDPSCKSMAGIPFTHLWGPLFVVCSVYIKEILIVHDIVLEHLRKFKILLIQF